MDIAVSRWVPCGAAVAADSVAETGSRLRRKTFGELMPDQHHVCTGAVDNTLAGLATERSGVCSLLTSWRFDCVLRRAPGN